MASANDEIDHPFILLHLFFDTAWTAGLLKRAFFGDYDTCEEFWNSAEGREHLRQHLCHPLGSHSFKDGACRTTRSWRVALAPKLAVRSVLEQLVWLGNSDWVERFIFGVIRKAELTSATWDTIWKIFLWSMDVMLGVAFEKMGRCDPRLGRGKCWRKVGARCSRSPETTRTTTCAGFAWPAQGFKTCCTQEPPTAQQSGRTSLGRMNCVSKGSRCWC